MKFHETSFDDYITEHNNIDFHPEITENFHNKLVTDKQNMGNLILYGPSGTGKYTQALKIIKKYSPSELKYDKKLYLNSEKYNFVYKISDIHYEIDISLLGCNAKLVWHEVFQQIVDIISMSTSKFGIILCKNFHTIHVELLPIFYSYMQQYNNKSQPFQIKYILLTEQISFISNNILNYVKTINVKHPDKNIYYDYLKIPETIDNQYILNLKETKLLQKIENDNEIPQETFDVITNLIIKKMNKPEKIILSEFRETLYDILIYNLDFIEVLWNIIENYVQENRLVDEKLNIILFQIYNQIKQYNNNYRPIYHLENILLNIVNQFIDE
jgi:hypothetical protein